MPKVIITGHGSWPKGLYEAGKMIFSAPDSVEYLCLEGEIEDFKKKFRMKMEDNRGDQLIVLCDLQGGTPYNEALRYALENEGVSILAGMNLPGYLELVSSLTMGMEIDLKRIQEIASKSVVQPVLIDDDEEDL